MSKKVLILSGSPRKNGNSDLLCDEFMRGALDNGNEVEKFVLPKRKLIIAVPVTIAVKTMVSVVSMMIWQIFFKK